MEQSSRAKKPDASATAGPLAGLRVLDCATILAAPLICQVLGDFGADVIKVEHPEAPDGMRGHGRAVDGRGLWWKEVGRNKRAIALHLGRPEGAEVLLDLVRDADVLVENFRPGTLERWGLGPQQLHEVNPGLILVRVTGFGQEGPYRNRPAFGTLIEAMSGFAHLTGQPDGPPTLPPFGLADSIAGLAGVSATMMALYHRDQAGGRGQVVDVDLLSPMMTAIGPAPTIFAKTGESLKRQGNRSVNNAPRNLYRTSDGGWIAISTSTNKIAERVLTLVGHPEVIGEPWFVTGAERAKHADYLDGLVGEWIAARPRAQVLAEFEAAGAAVSSVYAPEDLVNDDHVRQQELLTAVEDEHLGTLLQHNVLFRMSATPGAIRFTGRDHGADTDEVLTQLGYGPDRIQTLRGAGVVR